MRHDISGKRFGRLVAKEFVGVDKWRNAIWRCQCDCGTVKETTRHSLVVSGTKSCGCLQREAAKRTMTKHGQYKTSEYRVWEGLFQRCENSGHPSFRHYGGRGIKVCDRWRDFQAFRADMGSRPAHTSIDRIDPNGNYEPGNCRWASNREQHRNKRSNVFYEINGVRKIVTDWAAHYGINIFTLRSRLRYGWPIERALTEEVR